MEKEICYCKESKVGESDIKTTDRKGKVTICWRYHHKDRCIGEIHIHYIKGLVKETNNESRKTIKI